MELFTDEYWMGKALEEAKKAYEEEEIPIGAIVVLKDRIIGKGYNQTEKLTDVTAHAEMLAITAAASAINSKFLNECTLYVTIEPCHMCAGAIKWARLDRIVFGAAEPKFGFSHGCPGIISGKTEILGGVMEHECAKLMQDFFRARR